MTIKIIEGNKCNSCRFKPNGLGSCVHQQVKDKGCFLFSHYEARN